MNYKKKKRSGELTLHTNHDIHAIKQQFLIFFGGRCGQKQKVTDLSPAPPLISEQNDGSLIKKKDKYDTHMYTILQTILGRS